MKAFDEKKLANKIFFTNCHTKIFGLDLNPYSATGWIRTQNTEKSKIKSK
jgi:hypothetical protein